MPKYKIETISGMTFYKNKQRIENIPEVLRRHSVISIVERGENVFALGGTKQCWRKKQSTCIVDSRPNIMATKMGML